MGTVVCHPSTTKCCSNICWVLFPLFFASSVGLWLSFCVRSQVFYTQPAPWDATDITRPLFSRVPNITICDITQLRQHSWWPSYYCFKSPRKKATGLQNKRVLLQLFYSSLAIVPRPWTGIGKVVEKSPAGLFNESPLGVCRRRDDDGLRRSFWRWRYSLFCSIPPECKSRWHLQFYVTLRNRFETKLRARCTASSPFIVSGRVARLLFSRVWHRVVAQRHNHLPQGVLYCTSFARSFCDFT